MQQSYSSVDKKHFWESTAHTLQRVEGNPLASTSCKQKVVRIRGVNYSTRTNFTHSIRGL